MTSMRATLVLLAAAARAWDFDWKATAEGWAPAGGKRPESDPFWVDHAACEADTRPPRRETRGRALTGNLLRNGGPDAKTMVGWSVVNGGDGWSAKEGVFKTSFEPNTRRQIVSLIDYVGAATLDSGTVEIVLGEQITKTGSRDKYFIRAALCRDPACNSKVARWAPCRCEKAELASSCALTEAYCVTRGAGKSKNDLGHDKPGGGDRTRDDAWRDLSYTFLPSDVVGARYILFEDGGCSGEFWKGLWGPWFRHASVKVYAVAAGEAPANGGLLMRDLLFGASLFAVLAAYVWIYRKNRAVRVGERTSLLSDENPFDRKGVEITEF